MNSLRDRNNNERRVVSHEVARSQELLFKLSAPCGAKESQERLFPVNRPDTCRTRAARTIYSRHPFAARAARRTPLSASGLQWENALNIIIAETTEDH
jgi:hypothetical protein